MPTRNTEMIFSKCCLNEQTSLFSDENIFSGFSIHRKECAALRKSYVRPSLEHNQQSRRKIFFMEILIF
jgi:hypothetical protein